MARSNTASGSNYSLVTSPAVAALPATFACWVKPNNITTTQSLVNVTNAAGTNYLSLVIDGNAEYAAGDLVIADANGGGSNSGKSGSAFSANVWNHVCAVFTSTTSRQAGINGVLGTANTNSRSLTSPVNTSVGAFRNTSPAGTFGPLDGSMGEAAIWNVALNANELAALAAGACPLLIRPESLVAYWPWAGDDSPETDWHPVGATRLNLTLTGTLAKANHAPVGFTWEELAGAWIDPPTGGAVVGDSSVTLAGTTGSATAAIAIQSAASGTLAGATGSATTSLAIQGAGAGTLAGATGSATGALVIQGASAATLAGVSGSESGALALQGAGSGQLAGATGSGSCSLALAGSGSGTLAGCSGSGTGALAIHGTATGSLDGASGTSVGVLPIAGTSSATLGGASGTAVAVLAIQAVANSTLDGAGGIATGSVGAVLGAPVAAKVKLVPIVDAVVSLVPVVSGKVDLRPVADARVY